MLNKDSLRRHVNKHISQGLQSMDLKAIRLIQEKDTGHRKPVMSWEVKPDTDENKLVEEMFDTAMEDANSIGGELTYEFRFYFGGQSGEGYGARFPFRIEGEPSFHGGDDEHGGGGGGFTSGGMAGMGQVASLATDLTKSMGKLVLPWSDRLMNRMDGIIQRQESQINELMGERRRNIILFEKLMSRSHQRQLQLRKVIFWEKQKEELASIVFPMIPPLIAGLAGKALPAKRTAETVSFEQFVGSLSDEQMLQMQQFIRPPQMPALMQIVSAFREKRGIDPTVLREFLKSIDEPQMEQFKEILTEEQAAMLLSVIRSFMQQYADRQHETRQAYEDMEEGMKRDESEMEDVIPKDHAVT